jgi:hypothetical protein
LRIAGKRRGNLRRIIVGLSALLLVGSGFIGGFIFQDYVVSNNEFPTLEGPLFPDSPSRLEGEPASLENLPSGWGNVALFILAGQSNMSGRGLEFNPDETDSRVLVFGNDYRWHQAIEPVDDPTGQVDQVSEDLGTGYSPGMAFALASLEHNPRMIIGLIPCAKGASSIKEWQRDLSDQSLYGSCLKRVRAASTAGQVQGILFFQGEADAVDPDLLPEHPPDAENWPALFISFVQDFRTDLLDPRLPVVFAQIGMQTAPSVLPNWDLVKQKQESVQLPWTAMIVTDDLPLQDEVHFTTESYRIIGRRFSEAYWSLVEQAP